MNIRMRISKLEVARGQHRELYELSDFELETRIRELAGPHLALADDEALTAEVIERLIASTKKSLCEHRQPGVQAGARV